MDESVLAIKEIYERWLDGSLPQEDALFAIGDVLSGTSASTSDDVGSAGADRHGHAQGTLNSD